MRVTWTACTENQCFESVANYLDKEAFKDSLHHIMDELRLNKNVVTDLLDESGKLIKSSGYLIPVRAITSVTVKIHDDNKKAGIICAVAVLGLSILGYIGCKYRRQKQEQKSSK